MNTSIEPIELTDDELKAVAGGSFSVTATNSTVANSFNNVANISLTNSSISNSTVG
jgi:hypothetical protein